jgi:hypothetical protein
MILVESLTEKQNKAVNALLRSRENDDLTEQEAFEDVDASASLAYKVKKKHPETFEEIKQRRSNEGLTNGSKNGSVSVEMGSPEPFSDADAKIRLSKEQVQEAAEDYVVREMFGVDAEAQGSEYYDGKLIVGVQFGGSDE